MNPTHCASGGENMFKIRILEIVDSKVKNHFQHEFHAHPKIGDWIELHEFELGGVFEVIQVIFSTKSDESDIYVKLVGSRSEAFQSLVEKTYNQ